MQIGKQEVIAVFMLICLCVAAFFMGVKWSYEKAADYANDAISEGLEQCRIQQLTKPGVLPNITISTGWQDE